MLMFALKKMLRNKWMICCLLLGSIVFVAVLSLIPTYSYGVYNRMLLRDLEAQQIDQGDYPGIWFLNVTMKKDNDDTHDGFALAREFDRRVEDSYIPGMRLPVLASRRHYALDRFFYHSRITNDAKQISILGVENFWDHVDIVSGRLPSNSDVSNNVMEFVMPKSDYNKSDISMNQEFDLFSYAITDTDRQFGKAVCVGVFEERSEEPFWYHNVGFGAITFIIDYDDLVSQFVETESMFVAAKGFYYCFDYTEIKLEDVDSILNVTRRVRADIQGNGYLVFPMGNTLQQYLEKRDTLEFMLWVLVIPVIVMLVFYIYMVSALMIGYESNEIAVLKSRGARNMQVFSVYALISALIAGISFILGPLLGLFAARVLGLSNGFMELVSRHGLVLSLSISSYAYAGIAALVFIIVMLIPALRATRDTIVISKRKKSRRISAPLWQKLWLDAVLIAASLYALNLYRSSAQMRALSDISGMGAPIDPLMLIASSMFVLGAGLAFLRLFPWLVKLIYFLGKHIWPPALYSTLLSILRYRGNSRFLTLFLVFNLGLGLFNATTARTLNRFLDERVRYENGADIVLTQSWPIEMLYYRVEISDDGEVSYHRTTPPGLMGDPDASDGMIIQRTNVKEPPFDVFQRLNGVENATKVFRRDHVNISAGQKSTTADIMGIVPHEFGQVAWFRNNLLPTHLNNYLNLMTADPSAILLSSAMRDDYGFKVGDSVKVGWSEQSSSLDGTIYGFVEYWPSINPVLQPHFIIANIKTIHSQMRMEPYSVWLSLNENTTSYELYESINEAEIRITDMIDTRQDLIALKNDPLLQGINGSLTLGFIVTLCITFIGFLIYWILSIRSRLLQFGILRAMGLSRLGLVTTLLWEQLFVSGSAVIAGFGAGILTSRLFVPTFQLLYSASEQVPPFLTTSTRSDYMILISAFGGMLIAGLTVLTAMIRRLKPDQVLKLGED